MAIKLLVDRETSFNGFRGVGEMSKVLSLRKGHTSKTPLECLPTLEPSVVNTITIADAQGKIWIVIARLAIIHMK